MVDFEITKLEEIENGKVTSKLTSLGTKFCLTTIHRWHSVEPVSSTMKTTSGSGTYSMIC